MCTSVLPASKTPVDQKSIILTPCTSAQRKLENEQRSSGRAEGAVKELRAM